MLPTHYTQQNALTVIPPSTVSYLDIRRDADRYPRLAAVPREVAASAMEQIVFRAFFNNAGTQLRDDDAVSRVQLIATELLDLILEDYEGLGTKHLSFAEVGRVIRTASVSAKREMFGVSVSSLYRAICDYCLGEGHKASIQAQREKFEKSRPAMDRSQIIEEQRQTIETVARRLASAKNLNGR